jgi:hypothetical protein
MRLMVFLVLSSLALAQQPFQSLEGAVGYIIIEKNGKVENYVVVEGKDGSVRAVKTDRKPSEFLRKTEEGEGGKK